MRNRLIIHGHFYQPPRENPWTGLVPHHGSAAPYENWNLRITKECYAANAASRILDPQGKIHEITNNYRSISFNFGPTLMQWLKEHAPQVHARIIDADRASRPANAGHGNAIAQAYNHSILPLCSPEDMETQIRWGLSDFTAHFGRAAEGMWLPETAVSGQVLDALIAAGMKFVILSPWQAASYCPLGASRWKNLGGAPIPSDRAYRIDRPSGSIAAFFYNHELAQGISFEHYLRDADELYERLLELRQASRPERLVNVATDGEVYGHHEPFGDMCLAALLRRVQTGQEFQLTNYAAYLEEFPPRYLVRLKEGEEGLGTSWSCSHGVGRWFRDCGCSTGGREGWNQKWRQPLRQALLRLQAALDAVYRRRIAALASAPPRRIRNEYGAVLTGAQSPGEFAARWIDRVPNDAGNARVLFSLLESQRMGLFMFTSCAWFFADLSGIETVQGLAYAVRAAELAQPFTEERLLEGLQADLETARSNLQREGSGADILQRRVLEQRRDLFCGAALFVIRWLLDGQAREESLGCFRAAEPGFRQEDAQVEGTLTVERFPFLERGSFRFHIDESNRYPLRLTRTDGDGEEERVSSFGQTGGPPASLLSDLPAAWKTALLRRLADRLVAPIYAFVPQSVAEIRALLEFAYSISTHGALPPRLVKLAELTLEILIERITTRPTPEFFERDLPQIGALVQLMQANRLSVNQEFLERRLSGLLATMSEGLGDGLPAERIRRIAQIVESCRRIGLQPELTRAQNVVFELLQRELPRAHQELRERGDLGSLETIRLLIRLAGLLEINVERFKERFFAPDGQ